MTTEQIDEPVGLEMAAKALSCSRRTVERLIARGELQRAECPIASVTRLSLVALIETRRDSDATGVATGVAGVPSGIGLLPPMIEALLDRVAVAEVRAASAEAQLRVLEAGLEDRQDHRLLIARMASGSFRERRAARREAIAALATPSYGNAVAVVPSSEGMS